MEQETTRARESGALSHNRPIGVLFVCLGNICRSPLAEGVFLHKVAERGLADRFRVDSAGTGGWHEGEPADPRSCAVAKEYGVALPSRARKVRRSDFKDFDYLIAMDHQNYDDLLSMGAPAEKLSLLLEYDQSHHLKEVPDPYYGGPEGFQTIYKLIDRACDCLIDAILKPSEGGR
jgi:protein-tyrosine phosphatase